MTASGPETEALTTPTPRDPLPWIFLAVAVFGAGLLSVASQQAAFALQETPNVMGWVVVLMAGAAAGIMAAAQRDVVSRGALLDAITLTAAVGLFSWMFPRFVRSDGGWDDISRLRLTSIGVGLGALLAAIIILGLIRRPPSIASASFVGALALVLASRIAAPANELVSAGLALASCLAFVVSWVNRDASEPDWTPPERRLRRPRWVLSLITAGAAAYAIEAYLRVDRPQVGLGSVVIAGVLTLAAVVSAVSLRREIQYEQGAFDGWFSPKRAQHNAEFEAALFDYEPEPPRPLSEWTTAGELKLADESFWSMLGIRSQTDFHFGAIAHPDDRAALATALTLAVGHRQRLDHTFRAVDPTSGRERTVRLTTTPSTAGTVLIEAQRVGTPRTPENRIAGFDDPALSHPLSGLHNTTYVERWLERHAVESQRHTDNAMLVIIELLPLDAFDQLPDALADVVVSQIGHRLRDSCRSLDFVAHLDGPYFLWGSRLAEDNDRGGLLERITGLLQDPTPTTPPVVPQYRMVTLRVEPGVDISRVLGVAAAAFTTEL